MLSEQRNQIAKAIAGHERPWDSQVRARDLAAADAVIQLIEALPPRVEVDFSECGLGPDAQAELGAAAAALADQYVRDGLQERTGLVELRRRSPEQRRRYLLEHRADAIARGIPEQLVDQLIDEAG